MLTKQAAYKKWLGIKEHLQPVNLYRLLGIERFESDPEIISNAADSRMGFLRQFQAGKHQDVAAEVLNEIAQARLTLLNPAKKAAYDQELRQRLAAQRTPPPAPPVLVPVEAVDEQAATRQTAEPPRNWIDACLEKAGLKRADVVGGFRRAVRQCQAWIRRGDAWLKRTVGEDNDILYQFLRVATVVAAGVVLLVLAVMLWAIARRVAAVFAVLLPYLLAVAIVLAAAAGVVVLLYYKTDVLPPKVCDLLAKALPRKPGPPPAEMPTVTVVEEPPAGPPGEMPVTPPARSPRPPGEG